MSHLLAPGVRKLTLPRRLAGLNWPLGTAIMGGLHEKALIPVVLFVKTKARGTRVPHPRHAVGLGPSLSGNAHLMVNDLLGRIVQPLGPMAQVQSPGWSLNP